LNSSNYYHKDRKSWITHFRPTSGVTELTRISFLSISYYLPGSFSNYFSRTFSYYLSRFFSYFFSGSCHLSYFFGSFPYFPRDTNLIPCRRLFFTGGCGVFFTGFSTCVSRNSTLYLRWGTSLFAGGVIFSGWIHFSET
jgi:hypothetical protein